MLKRELIGLMSLLCFITSAPIKSLADDLFIYSTKNQSPERQNKAERDRGNRTAARARVLK